MADVFRSIENVAKAGAKVDELLTEGAVPRYSQVRWNSKFETVCGKKDPQKATQWLRCLLPESRYADFQKEKEEFCDTQVLEAHLNVSNFPVHKTSANLILKMPLTEAAVERAFSRHKIVHTRLRANLKTENLETQLFIRYNIERILKIASEESKTEDVKGEILTWLCNVDID